MRLLFLPGELVLEKTGDDYVVTVKGEEVFRASSEKKALAAYNRLRKQMESQFPAHELTVEEKRAWLDKLIVETKVGLGHNSVRPQRKKPAKSRTYG